MIIRRKKKPDMRRRVGRYLVGTDRKRGSNHPLSKLTESDIPVIRRRANKNHKYGDYEGEPLAAIAKGYGVSRSTIIGIVEGRTWIHVPD